VAGGHRRVVALTVSIRDQVGVDELSGNRGKAWYADGFREYQQGSGQQEACVNTKVEEKGIPLVGGYEIAVQDGE
jgi:hypothetical protein